MKEFFTIIVALFLCSCFNDRDDGTPDAFGWRSAGLMPNLDSLNKWGNGYMDIVHSGKYIFVRDGKVSNPQALKPDNRIFMSMQGSNTWEEIQRPEGVVVYTIYADESGLYVSDYDVGRLWHYDPSTKKWKNMNIQISGFEFTAKLNVYGIAKYNGQLVVSIGNYVAGLGYTIAFILMLQPDGTWRDISPPDNWAAAEDYMNNPLYFYKAVEWRGKLFTISDDVGTWVYDGLQWKKLPCPEGQISSYTGESFDSPTAIAVHKDRIYTGQWAYQGVQEVRDDYSRVRVDSNTAPDGSYYNYQTPFRIKTLVSTGEHLVVAGIGPSMPHVYMGDKGEPKGWRALRQGWCDKFRCIAQETYGLDVVGDTLYAAT